MNATDFLEQEDQPEAGEFLEQADLSGVKPSPYEKVYLETGMLDPGMQAGTEFTVASRGGLAGVMAAASQALLKPVGFGVAEALNQMGLSTSSETAAMQPPTPNITAVPGQPIGPPLPLAAPTEKGIIPSLSRAVDVLRTPETIGAMALAPLSPQAVGATFLAQVPEAYASAAESLATAKTPAEVRGALTDLALAELLRRGTTKGTEYAVQPKDAQLHAGMRPRYEAEQARAQVPAEISGAETRVGGRETGLQKEAQVLLSPEERTLIETERKAIDAPDIEFEEAGAIDQPFAARRTAPGIMATIDPAKGTIVIDPVQLRDWLQRDVPPENRSQAVRSMLAEEKNHLQRKRTITDEETAGFWQKLTGFERRAHFRRYTGEWTPEALQQKRGITFTDAQLGDEAINSMMMRAARMPLREFVEATGREKWTVGTLDSLANIVFKVRKSLGTKASADQVAILDRIDANIKGAISAMGAAPAAMRKRASQDELDRIVRMPAEEFNAHVKQEGRGLTGSAYDLGQRSRTEDIPKLEAARDAAAAERKRIMAEPARDMPAIQRIASAALKRQYFQEAIQWRQALDAARQRDAVLLDDFADIEREFGVGKAGKPGEDLRLAFDREESARAVEPFKTSKLPPVEPGMVRLFNGSPSATRASEWWARSPEKASTFGQHIRYVDLPTQDVLRFKERAMEEGRGGDTHLLDQATLTKAKVAGVAERPVHELGAPQSHREGVIEGLKLSREDIPRLQALKDQADADMRKAFDENDAAKAQEAFGRFNYYGGQLEGAMRAGPNFEAYMAEGKGQPAALRKGRGEPERELFLPPAQVGEERPTALQLGAKEITPARLQQTASDFIKTSDALKFSDFVKKMREEFGEVRPGQLQDVWTQSVWSNLESSTGAELSSLRERLGLTPRLGREPIPEPLSMEYRLQGKMPKAVSEDIRKANVAKARHRAFVIRRIGQALMRQVVPNRRALRRTEVTPDDVAYGRESSVPAYEEISPSDSVNADYLDKILTADARTSGHKVSETKRLTVLVDKRTGQTHMVSTYLDPRRGTVLIDPVAPKGTHVAIGKVLPRYRAIASVLLDEPVQNFKQSWKSLRDYQNQFGADVRGRYSAGQTLDVPYAEGEFVPGPTTGRYAAPGVFQPGSGLLSGPARRPVTNAEATAILDHILGQEGSLNSANDVKAAWTRLGEEPNYAAISGYRKLAQEIARKNPNMAGDEVLNRLAQQIYENHASPSTFTVDDFVARTVAQGRPPVAEAVRPVEEAPPTGQELTMIARRPPTAVAGLPARPGPGPMPRIPPAEPPEMLTPEARRHVEAISTEPAQPPRMYEAITKEPLEVGGKATSVVQTSQPQFELIRPGKPPILGPKTATVPAALRKSVSGISGSNIRRSAGTFLDDVLLKPLSYYSEWMADRIQKNGGEAAQRASRDFKQIIDYQKELYGGLTPVLDPALRKAGALGRGTTWLNRLNPVTDHAAISNTPLAIEGKIPVPEFAKDTVDSARTANLKIGQMYEAVTKGFKATGQFQRNLTAFGYDIIRQGMGPAWQAWTTGIAQANGASLFRTQTFFREWKEILDKPGPSIQEIDKVNQDFQRQFPRAITHIRVGTMWQPVMHADLFSYLRVAAERASHVRAFRERFPNTPEGRKEFRALDKAVRKEVGPEYQQDLDALYRTLQGHPTDNYSRLGFMAPGHVIPETFRFLNQTVGGLFARLVLTGQMFVQQGEVIAGATPVFLGYRNYLRAIARAREIYPELEKAGAVNRVIYDWAFDPQSPVRSAFRIAGNSLSRAFGESALNELQETLAASTAHVVSERIRMGTLSEWEKAQLPQTFDAMGFTPGQARSMMAGDEALLGEFQRKAAAFLTSGNKAMAEGSRLGANRLLNSVFRFQMYPMMKMNQLRNVVRALGDAWESGDRTQRLTAANQFARFMFGTTLQGVLTMGIVNLFYGGPASIKITAAEAKDEPLQFLTESFLATMSGPLYLVWRGGRSGGIEGIGEQTTRLIFPYSVLRDVWDMVQGTGSYRDMTPFDAMGKFVSLKMPGTRFIAQAMAATGLSSRNVNLDTSISAFYRWQREYFKDYSQRDWWSDPEGSDFRTAMKKAVRALKDGDLESYYENYYTALGMKTRGKTSQQAVSASLSQRQILKRPDGRPLTLEDDYALRQHIGEDAYQRVKYFDEMLKAAAGGQVLPPPD